MRWSPRSSWPRRSQNVRAPLYELGILTTLLVFFGVSSAQTSAQQAQPRTLPEAVMLARSTLNALGGQGVWMQISSVSSVAVITNSAGAPRTITWVDDWSSGTLRSLRATSNGSTGSSTGSPIVPKFSYNGKSVVVPSQSDYITLAISTPGEALLRGLSKGDCHFYPEGDDLEDRFSTHAVPSGQLAFAQACSGTSNSNGALHWRVNASTFMPISVSIPVRAFGSNSYIYTLVSYVSFATVGAASMPSKVLLTSNTNNYRQIQFSGFSINQASVSAAN